MRREGKTVGADDMWSGESVRYGKHVNMANFMLAAVNGEYQAENNVKVDTHQEDRCL